MNHSRLFSARNLVQSASIAALYVALTALSAQFGLSGTNLIQLRLSEALTVLPYFTPAAIPGLILGCLLSNLLTTTLVWDIVFGTLATAIGAVGTYLLRRYRFLSPLPPLLANTLVVPFILAYGYGLPESLPLLFLTTGIGEILSCGVLGLLLLHALRPHANTLFRR